MVDLTQTTSAELHGVMYFGAMGWKAEELAERLGGDAIGGGLRFGMDGVAEADMWEALTDVFIPDTPVDRANLADDQGHIAHISPIGITFEAPSDEFADPDSLGTDRVTGGIALQLADGSTYVVEGEDVHNSYCSYYTLDGDMVLVFNRLVDPAQVTGITVGGPGDTTLVFVR